MTGFRGRKRIVFVLVPADANTREEQKFFASFFQKRSACFLLIP
jgi:hypothetical protein